MGPRHPRSAVEVRRDAVGCGCRRMQCIPLPSFGGRRSCGLQGTVRIGWLPRCVIGPGHHAVSACPRLCVDHVGQSVRTVVDRTLACILAGQWHRSEHSHLGAASRRLRPLRRHSRRPRRRGDISSYRLRSSAVHRNRDGNPARHRFSSRDRSADGLVQHGLDVVVEITVSARWPTCETVTRARPARDGCAEFLAVSQWAVDPGPAVLVPTLS